LIGAAVVSWFVARSLGSRTLFLMVYAGVLVLGVSYVVARKRLALSVERSALPARMREGQSAEVTLKVQATKRATTLLVHETLHPALGKPVRVPIASISAGEEIEHTYTLAPTRRGVYEIGPTTASWSDPFGLTVQSQELMGTTTLIVHPSTELVRDPATVLKAVADGL